MGIVATILIVWLFLVFFGPSLFVFFVWLTSSKPGPWVALIGIICIITLASQLN